MIKVKILLFYDLIKVIYVWIKRFFVVDWFWSIVFVLNLWNFIDIYVFIFNNVFEFYYYLFIWKEGGIFFMFYLE